MADIRRTDTLAETGPGIPDEALGPGEEASFEIALERADGAGPTLGQNLGQAQARAKSAPDADWNDEAYDPPT